MTGPQEITWEQFANILIHWMRTDPDRQTDEDGGDEVECTCHHESGSHELCCGHENGRDPNCPLHGDGSHD